MLSQCLNCQVSTPSNGKCSCLPQYMCQQSAVASCGRSLQKGCKPSSARISSFTLEVWVGGASEKVKLTTADLNHKQAQASAIDTWSCALEVTFARPLRSKSNIKKSKLRSTPTHKASAVWQFMNRAGTQCRSKQCVPTTRYLANYETILSRNDGDKWSWC